jgi:hypothetical protein
MARLSAYAHICGRDLLCRLLGALLIGVAVVPAAFAGNPELAKPTVKERPPSLALRAERQLAALGYWTGPVDGRWDSQSQSALVAFQKVERRRRSGQLNATEVQAIEAAARPAPLESGPAHIEVDISRQVLFVVAEGGVVDLIVPVSTGNGKSFTFEGVRDRAYTPRGRCTVYRKIKGIREAPLGTIHYPNYLVGGIAIHGSPSVPAKPASHGCIRVPLFACKRLSELMPVGTLVLVHDNGSFENDAIWMRQAQRQRPANSEALLAMAGERE